MIRTIFDKVKAAFNHDDTIISVKSSDPMKPVTLEERRMIKEYFSKEFPTCRVVFER